MKSKRKQLRLKCVCDLSRRPSFGSDGDKKPTWCLNCPSKPPNAVDVVSRKCLCGLARPNFGLPGEKSPTWCVRCPSKHPRAIDIMKTRCVCGLAKPSFARVGEKRPIWCKSCPQKESTAINIVNKKCACGQTKPCFGLPGDQKPSWCEKCPDKHPDASDIVHPRCVCGLVRPSFGLPGDRKAIWCSACPTKSTDAVNVVSRMCACKRARPSFGLPGDKRPTWCFQCPAKPFEAEDITASRCLSDFCQIIVNGTSKKYRGYCLHCFVNLFPDEPVSKNFKVKENIVRELVENLLKNQYAHLESSFDKSVVGGCSKKRPDIFIDALTHVVFGEVDEEAHDTADYCSCENKRMMTLFSDVGSRPSVFLRLNPDAFTDAKGKKHKSCFKKTKTGKLIVANQKELDFRVNILLERIKHHLDNVSSQEIQIEHLFYNGFAV